MRKLFRFLLGLAACGVLVFATLNLVNYLRESNQSANLNEGLIDKAVAIKAPEPQSSDVDFPAQQESEADTERLPMETAPIEVDFEVLLETNEDVVGWIYCEDTLINLPIVQAEDNDYYLRRMIDGTWNSSGTLFADYRNAADFSDSNTIIYGHNMHNKGMFGTLSNYKEQSYYYEHPIMWLLTPDGNYKVELIAGYVTLSTSEIYSFGQTEEEVFALAEQSIEESTFTSDFQVSQGDRFVTLSTCSHEYYDARYVLIGRLIPLT